MINVFTTYYEDKNPVRQKEYIEAITINVNNTLIDRIFLLHEKNISLPFASDKIHSIIIETRPTFQQFFEEINQYSSVNDINILMNTDIYFDQTLMLTRTIKDNEVYALNRWDVISESKISLFAKYSTSDTWIFKGKVKCNDVNYYLGQLGCDNRLLFDLKKSGYKILNPSLSIKSYHLHHSNIRNELSDPKNNIRVLSPYVYSVPNFLNRKDFLRLFITKGGIYVYKLLIIQRMIRFQYYYDKKNNIIEYEHELVDVIRVKKWKYWLYHDFGLPLHNLNLFSF